MSAKEDDIGLKRVTEDERVIQKMNIIKENEIGWTMTTNEDIGWKKGWRVKEEEWGLNRMKRNDRG